MARKAIARRVFGVFYADIVPTKPDNSEAPRRNCEVLFYRRSFEGRERLYSQIVIAIFDGRFTLDNGGKRFVCHKFQYFQRRFHILFQKLALL